MEQLAFSRGALPPIYPLIISKELSSSAEWVKRAVDIARRKEQDGGYGAQKVCVDVVRVEVPAPDRLA